MSKKKRRPKQNSFLRFFSILSRLARSFPYKLKRNTTVVCAVLIALGIILSAVAMPKADTEKKESAEQKKEPTTVAATQPTAAKTAVGHRINGIPIISQDYFKAGCETYACTMMLQGLGYDIDEYKFVENYLITSSFSYDEAGNMYGPDMNSAFAGDIFTGAGIFCPAMAKSMNKYLDTVKNDDRRAYPIKGETLAQLCQEYIDKDIPVMTWVTTYMEESYERLSWIVDYVDANNKPMGKRACVKVTDQTKTWGTGGKIGYTDKEYIFCDSVAGKVVAHDKQLAETRFKEIGNQAVVVK